MKNTYRVREDDAGHRLDVVLVKRLGGTRSYWQKQVKYGYVTVNGSSAKPGLELDSGQVIAVEPPEQFETPSLSIAYEDADMLIVDKPAGLLVHPTATSREATVSHFSALHTSDSDAERPGVVHRLDRETSGLLILAKSPDAKIYLQLLFKTHGVKKTYQALVTGHLDKPEATISLPIGRNLRHPSRRAVTPIGRLAVTRYRVEREWPGYSLVQVMPQTGRTHQIRVHLSHIGHPIVGDAMYGASGGKLGLKRQFLHACELEFMALSGKHVKVRSELPPDLMAVIKKLDDGYNK